MVGPLTPLQIIPGPHELVIVLLIVALLFGASKIPQLARSTGEAMGEFQKGREQVEQELQEMRDGSADVSSEAAGGATGATDASPEAADEPGDDVAVEEAEDQ